MLLLKSNKTSEYNLPPYFFDQMPPWNSYHSQIVAALVEALNNRNASRHD